MTFKPIEISRLEQLYHIELSERDHSLSGESDENYYLLNKDKEVIELVLIGCKITSIFHLRSLPKLQRLVLRNNQIKELGALKTCRNLEYLDLQGNLIEDIIVLKYLDSLTHVNISNNRIRDLSPLFRQLSEDRIAFFNADFNNLIYPPTEFETKSTYDIVKWFNGIWENARQLISENRASESRSLDLGNCGLTDMSYFPELFECIHLEEIILSNEWAQYIDDGWQRITSQNKGIPNNIFFIPTEFTNLKNLKVIICGGDWRSKRARESWNRWRITGISLFTNFRKLTYLNLSNNKIRSISNLGRFQRIQSLHLNNNEIYKITNSTMLFDLEEIYLSNNQLTDISFITTFNNVSTVDLHANYIKDLTPARSLIEKLDIKDTKWERGTININKNKLIHPTPQIISQGKAFVLAYFDQLKAEKSVHLRPFKNSDIKLILVGNSNAGKSTLAKWLETGKIDLNLPTTHWMDVVDWRIKIKTRNYNIRIFDFGGQEYYHDTHHLFFTRQTAYVLLWDRETNNFDEIEIEQKQQDESVKKIKIQSYPLAYWLDSIQYYTSKRSILKGEEQINKLLDARDFEISQSLKKGSDWTRHVISAVNEIGSVIEGHPNTLIVQSKADTVEDIRYLEQQTLTQKHPRIFDFTSLSLKNEKRLIHFKDLLFELFLHTPILDQEFLGTWGAIKQRIELAKSGYTSDITFADFKLFCNETIRELPDLQRAPKKEMEEILFDDTDTRSFAQYLNDIGILLYFPENEDLKDKIFINQDYVLDKIYKILFGLTETHGEFSGDNVVQALSKKSFDQECETLISLMVHFKIVIAHPAKKNTFIAPLYLPKNPMKGVQIFLSAFQKPIYRFVFEGFIHKNVILEFFSIYGSKTLSEPDKSDLYYYWREGMVLKDDISKEIVMVKFVNGNPESQEAFIDIYCLHHTAGDTFLNSVIDELEKITRDRDVVKSVTLNGEDFIPVAQIHDAEARGHWVFQYKHKYYSLPDFKNYLKNKIKMKKVFISYSKADTAYLTKLENHLTVLKRNGTISTWNCRQLLAGEKWDGKIKKELEEAQIILFLVSDDFLATDYIYDIEIKRAIEREEKDPNVKVIPVILRSCYWEESPLAVYNTAPKKAQVVTLAGDIDEAFKNVVIEIKKVIETMA